MTSATSDEFRLTDDDVATVAARAYQTAGMWAAANPNRRHTVTAADLETLARTMVHAIGCTFADLRDSESAAVWAIARAHLGNTYNAAGQVVTR